MTVKFRAPCPVGVVVTYGGEVTELDAEQGTATLAIWAETEDGAKVIDRRRSRAVVLLEGAAPREADGEADRETDRETDGEG